MGSARTIASCSLAAAGAATEPVDSPPAANETAAPAQSPAQDAVVERIDAEAVVSASLDDVWRAWTTSEGAREFFAPAANIDLRLGGPYEIFFSTDSPEGPIGSNGCEVLSYIPNEMFSFTWNAPPQFAHARQHHTWVVLRFDEAGENRVRVRLSHLGWVEMKRQHPEHAGEWDQVREYFSKAWPYVVGNLEKRFDEGPLR